MKVPPITDCTLYDFGDPLNLPSLYRVQSNLSSTNFDYHRKIFRGYSMNAVERVKQILKERHIAVSKLERDLHFSNGYVSTLKKGTFPADRLDAIARYLNVSPQYLLYGDQEKPAGNDELDAAIAVLKRRPGMVKIVLALSGVSDTDLNDVFDTTSEIPWYEGDA